MVILPLSYEWQNYVLFVWQRDFRDVPRFEEWWLYKWVFKSPKLVTFNFYAETIPREFLLDTTYVCMYVLCKAAGN